MKKLPIYKLRIKESDSDELQVEAIALVDEPAILVKWQMFEKQIKFSDDKERQLVMAPVMLADFPIFRRDEKLGEHYVIFDKEEIYKIAQKFFRNGFASSFNIMHSDLVKCSECKNEFNYDPIQESGMGYVRCPNCQNPVTQKDKIKLEGVYILETFLVDESRGIRPPKDFKDITQGSWFITVKIDNREVWDKYVKTGELEAFSVEGMFDYEYSENIPQSEIDEIISIVENINK